MCFLETKLKEKVHMKVGDNIINCGVETENKMEGVMMAVNNIISAVDVEFGERTLQVVSMKLINNEGKKRNNTFALVSEKTGRE